MPEQTGLHLDLEAKARDCLSDRAACEAWVRDAAQLMGVIILALVGYDLRIAHSQKPGVSVLALIAESHIALHTWPEYGVVTLCAYSCKPFDEKKITSSFARTFGVDSWLTMDTAPRFGVTQDEAN